MKKLLICTTFFTFATLLSFAQTAKVYRAGVLLSTHSSLVTASMAANTIGDSILLSAHTFKEHDVPLVGGQIWQGTYTPIDSTIIDAESKGRVMKGIGTSITKKNKAVIVRDIICTHGIARTFPETKGGGICSGEDSVLLKGNTIVRNSVATHGGGVYGVFLMAHTKIMYNEADSSGGGIYDGVSLDSAEICFNKALFGGGASGLVYVNISSTFVNIHHNVAVLSGGGIFGTVNGIGKGYQVVYNNAPKGAGIATKPVSTSTSFAGDIRNAYLYNPESGGIRQNEIYLDGGSLYLEGCWFGQSDTVGLITQNPSFPYERIGKYAIANWSVNRSIPLTNKDTLFPVGAAFTYNDGTALPANACPWLVGHFSSSDGKMLTLNPTMSPTDTLASLFRTYVYPTKGDTSSKLINFLCYVDADTFRANPRVWGIDSISLDIKKQNIVTQVKIFPNPASEVLTIQGAAIGDTIAFYDMLGHFLKREIVKSASMSINVSDLAAGNYLLKIRTKEGAEGNAKISIE